MAEHKCDKCDKEFSTSEALEQHKKAKHYENKKIGLTSKQKKKYRNVGIIIILLGLIAWGMVSLIGNVNEEISECQTTPIMEQNIVSHQNAKLHIHPELTIMIDGIKQEIPGNIGVSPGIMRPVHTHEAGGVIHIEGPCYRDYKLGEFFEVWGKMLNETCILDKCGGTLEMTVNGVKMPNTGMREYVMRDHDQIVLTYNS